MLLYLVNFYYTSSVSSENKKQIADRTCLRKYALTLFVYLAMSAATSAEAVGIYRSVATGEGAAAVPKLDAAIMATEAGLLDTSVTAEVDVLSRVSFC